MRVIKFIVSALDEDGAHVADGRRVPWPLRERIAAALNRRGPLDVESVRSLWQSFLSGSRSVSWSRIWTLAALLEWSERNHVALA
jgi:hypothetical protein